MENNITTQHTKRIGYAYSLAIQKHVQELMPVILALYNKLKRLGHVYDVKTDRMTNIKNNLAMIGDADIYAGIIDPKAYTHNKKAMFINSEGLKFIIQIIDTPFEDSFKNQVGKGVRFYRTYSPIDKDCIEKAWRYTTTEQFVTGADLVLNAFSDLTSKSQIVTGRKVCSRPTVQRVIDDHNVKLNPCWYEAFISTSLPVEGNCDIGVIEGGLFSLIAVCEQLKIQGVEI